jgi:hypothetical protein
MHGIFVLNENMGKSGNDFIISPPIPLKKELAFPENCRNQNYRNFFLLQRMNKMIPEFIFHKNHQVRFYSFYESPCVSGSIGGQIKHIIRHAVISSDFVTRRRKKSNKNPVPGKYFSEFFEHRSALFKFTQRGTMKPDYFLICFMAKGFFELLKKVFSAGNPFPGFPVKRRNHPDGKKIKLCEEIVKKDH